MPRERSSKCAGWAPCAAPAAWGWHRDTGGWHWDTRSCPQLPAPHQGAATAQAGAEQQPGERELSNEWALSGGFHLFCFKFLTISVCRACRWSELGWRGEGTGPAACVCCRADTAQAHPLRPRMHLPEAIPVPSPGHCPPIWHQPLVSVSRTALGSTRPRGATGGRWMQWEGKREMAMMLQARRPGGFIERVGGSGRPRCRPGRAAVSSRGHSLALPGKKGRAVSRACGQG